MANIWIHNNMMFEQCDFAAPEETPNGIPLVKLRGSEEDFWVPKEQLRKVSFLEIKELFYWR